MCPYKFCSIKYINEVNTDKEPFFVIFFLPLFARVKKYREYKNIS